MIRLLGRQPKPDPMSSAQRGVYDRAVRQIVARYHLGMVYPDQYPEHRTETDRWVRGGRRAS